jgi:PPOX class probable F420-dependent enzyme
MPQLGPEEAQRRFLSVVVARLATVTSGGHPHIVPVTFAPAGPHTLVIAVDHKPKRTTALARLANIAANPNVALLADHYEDDWSQLWWVRADGRATVLTQQQDAAAHGEAVAPLVRRYEQYADRPPAGPAIVITVTRWSGWQSSG